MRGVSTCRSCNSAQPHDRCGLRNALVVLSLRRDMQEEPAALLILPAPFASSRSYTQRQSILNARFSSEEYWAPVHQRIAGPKHHPGSKDTSHGPITSDTGLRAEKFFPEPCPPVPEFFFRNSTNQLCRGANCSGTRVRPFSSRQSGRSRRRPVTASQSSGCLPATRNTT